jgi:hypothetical protein
VPGLRCPQRDKRLGVFVYVEAVPFQIVQKFDATVSVGQTSGDILRKPQGKLGSLFLGEVVLVRVLTALARAEVKANEARSSVMVRTEVFSASVF